ncbi:rhodanese-like domain-containing protein [bacterium]|nr:rhodanese-like domain-containing protein [bacterium]
MKIRYPLPIGIAILLAGIMFVATQHPQAKAKTNMNTIVSALQQGGTVIDVRTPEEFETGHYKNAINIPLDEIEAKLAKIKTLKQPLVLICRSGARSRSAVSYLRAHGIQQVHNGINQTTLESLERQ